MKQTARQTEAYDLAKGTLGREGEVGRLPSQAQCIAATIPRCSTAARGTSACLTSTIAHVNTTHPRPELDVVSVLSNHLTHPRPELDVVSVLSKNLSPVINRRCIGFV